MRGRDSLMRRAARLLGPQTKGDAMGMLWVLLFWAMQVSANLLFKYGTLAASRYWPCFLLGNAIGASSILVMMKIYSSMQANVALTIAGGGTFLMVQIALTVVFREPLQRLQYAGILLVMLGMMIVSLGNRPPEPTAERGVQRAGEFGN